MNIFPQQAKEYFKLADSLLTATDKTDTEVLSKYHDVSDSDAVELSLPYNQFHSKSVSECLKSLQL